MGAALVQRLVAADARVTVLDDLFTGKQEVVPAAARIVIGSVEDEALVRELVADVSVVFHLAARNIIASTKDPRSDFATNIGGTLNVLLAVRDLGVDRLVYTGTTSIYGNPRSIPINEDDHVIPLSPYAVSKLSGENYCLAFYESYGTPVSVVRYSNVYGMASVLTTHTAGWFPSSSPLRTMADHCSSTAMDSRLATIRTLMMPSTRQCLPRSGREPRARHSTSEPGSRGPSTSSPTWWGRPSPVTLTSGTSIAGTSTTYGDVS